MAAVASLQELPEKPVVFMVVSPEALTVMIISFMSAPSSHNPDTDIARRERIRVDLRDAPTNAYIPGTNDDAKHVSH